MSPEMTSKFVNGIRAKHLSLMPEVKPEAVRTLTERERQILGCLAQGASNREIAKLLNMSESTVKAHLQRIMRRFDFSSRVQAAVYAAERHMDRYLLDGVTSSEDLLLGDNVKRTQVESFFVRCRLRNRFDATLHRPSRQRYWRDSVSGYWGASASEYVVFPGSRHEQRH